MRTDRDYYFRLEVFGMGDNHRGWRYKKEHLDNIEAMENIHSHEEQLGRQTRAREKKCTPIKLDMEHQTAEFLGSGKAPYFTTLESCTCRDFSLRQLPCKHMYRLAHEVGVYSLGTVERSTDVTGVPPSTAEKTQETHKKGFFSDMTVVFTGKLQSQTRVSAEMRVRELGGSATTSVSDRVSLVVVGESPGSRKASKFHQAKELGIKIINEEEFLSLCDGSRES
jgi:NAD-dependent DNA ligase